MYIWGSAIKYSLIVLVFSYILSVIPSGASPPFFMLYLIPKSCQGIIWSDIKLTHKESDCYNIYDCFPSIIWFYQLTLLLFIVIKWHFPLVALIMTRWYWWHLCVCCWFFNYYYSLFNLHISQVHVELPTLCVYVYI